MKHFFVVAALVALIALASTVSAADHAGELRASNPEKKDSLCIACVLLTGLLNQRSLETGESPKTVFDDFCKASTNPIAKILCELVYDLFKLFGLDQLDPHTSPEVNCEKHLLCPSPVPCTLFKQWPPKHMNVHEKASMIPRVDLDQLQATVDEFTRMRAEFGDNWFRPDVPTPPEDGFWKEFGDLLQLLLSKAGIKGNIKNVFDEHIPMEADDQDGDRHSTIESLRGSAWRGRDCNDKDGSVYPGRAKVASNDSSVDYNCNGIVGSDSTGTPYKEKFCSKSEQRGMLIIGDSAAAHFRIPPFIMTPSQTFNDSNWDGLLYWLLNEADWPDCSWASGYQNVTNCPKIFFEANEIDSIYQRLRARNLCNHRDYQSVAVNGARTTNVAPNGTIIAIDRDIENDHPMLVFFALIGNDVCNGHPGMSHMTTVPVFKQKVLDSMAFLDTKLPAGSHVVFIPLADGLILHETLANRTHPLGVTYSDLYDFLICSDLAPCLGWMTSNATLRNLTQERANNLSHVYTEIVQEQKYNNFDMLVTPMGMMEKVVKEWVADGKDPAELIEPVDGFHPSTTSNVLMAKYLWGYLETNYPDFIGPVNPNNADIAKLFGNQGGY